MTPAQIHGVCAVANEIYRDIIPNCFLSHRLSPLHPNENTHLVSNVLLRRIYNNNTISEGAFASFFFFFFYCRLICICFLSFFFVTGFE